MYLSRVFAKKREMIIDMDGVFVLFTGEFCSGFVGRAIDHFPEGREMEKREGFSAEGWNGNGWMDDREKQWHT